MPGYDLKNNMSKTLLESALVSRQPHSDNKPWRSLGPAASHEILWAGGNDMGGCVKEILSDQVVKSWEHCFFGNGNIDITFGV